MGKYSWLPSASGGENAFSCGMPYACSPGVHVDMENRSWLLQPGWGGDECVWKNAKGGMCNAEKSSWILTSDGEGTYVCVEHPYYLTLR